jgi:hypothetical protein
MHPCTHTRATSLSPHTHTHTHTHTYTHAQQVYDAAHRLDVPNLVIACEQYSNEALAPCTACTLLQQAQLFQMHEYAEQCLSIIREK